MNSRKGLPEPERMRRQPGKRPAAAGLGAIACLVLPLSLGVEGLAAADVPPSRTGILRSITVGTGETVGKVVCIGCSVRVDGLVAGNAYVLLGRLENRGSIEGDSLVIGGVSEANGPTGGSALVVAGLLRLHTRVGGDAITVLADLELTGPDARIGGDAWTVIGHQDSVSPGAVGGAIRHVQGRDAGRMLLSGLVGGAVVVALAVVGCLLGLAVLCYLILGPKRLGTIADAYTGNAVPCFLVGLGTCFALVVVGLALAALLPISVPIAVVFSVLSVVGYAGLALGIGRNLLPGLNSLPATLVASLVLACAQAVPIVGWSVMVVLWNVAVGATVLSGFGSSSDWLAQRTEGRLSI